MLKIGCIVLSFLLSAASMPIIIKVCQKKNLYDYHDERKIHTGDIPRLGGIGIFFSFLISAFLLLVLEDSLSISKTLPLLISAFIIFAFAVLDDIFTFRALIKLIVQLLATAIVTINGFRFTQICGWVLPVQFSYILTFGWILGLINAYNLIDGLDGLCGSLSITAVTTLGILYLLSGNNEGYICFILAASILGFLCFNWPPAKIFMGDCGSQFLGFMIAIIPLYSSNGSAFEYNKFLIMIALAAFPVFDTIAAIWRRLRDKKPIMSPDKAHLHHKLLTIGYTRKGALFFVLSLQIIICIAIVVSYFMGTIKGTALLLQSIIFIVWIFAILHYTHRKVLKTKRLLDDLMKNGNVKPAEAASETNSKAKETPAEKPVDTSADKPAENTVEAPADKITKEK